MNKNKAGADSAGVFINRNKLIEVTVPYIPDNRALIVKQLTQKPLFALPKNPYINAKSTVELLSIVKPVVTVPMTNSKGIEVNETFTIEKISDFGPDGLSKKSELLTQLKRDKKNADLLEKLFSTILKKYLNEPNEKKYLVAQLQAALQELN